MMRIHSFFFKITLVCTVLLSFSRIQAQDRTNIDANKIHQEINALAEELIASNITPGVTIGVGFDNKIVFSEAYGKADLEIGRDARPLTVFGITSITKQFTAAAILKLMEQGKIDLDQSITTYLPEFSTQGNHVTVKNLLNHTSGIYSMKNTSSVKEKNWFSQDLTFEDMLNYFGEEAFEFTPGEKHSYNNFAYYLLGEIITRASGKAWTQYMEQELFVPANLDNTEICDADAMPQSGAKTYLKENDKFVVAPTVNKAVLGAAGALCSTVEDLIRWNHALHSGKIISASSLQLMKATTILSSGETINEGFGLYLEELGGNPKIAHGGGLPWGSYLSYYPEVGLSIAILTNSAKGGREAAEKLEKTVARSILVTKIESVEQSPEEMKIYEGDYLLRLGSQEKDFKIFRNDQNSLMAQLQGQQAAEIVYQGNNTFSFVVDPDIKLVFTVEGEDISQVVLHQGGREIPGLKK